MLQQCSGMFQYRYVLTVLAFFGYACNYMLRVNMNMAIVSMVNHTALDNSTNDKLNSTDKDNKQVNLEIIHIYICVYILVYGKSDTYSISPTQNFANY